LLHAQRFLDCGQPSVFWIELRSPPRALEWEVGFIQAIEEHFRRADALQHTWGSSVCCKRWEKPSRSAIDAGPPWGQAAIV